MFFVVVNVNHLMYSVYIRRPCVRSYCRASVTRRTFGHSGIAVHTWYACPALIKSIWAMAISQHQFYLDRKQSKVSLRGLKDTHSHQRPQTWWEIYKMGYIGYRSVSADICPVIAIGLSANKMPFRSRSSWCLSNVTHQFALAHFWAPGPAFYSEGFVFPGKKGGITKTK